MRFTLLVALLAAPMSALAQQAGASAAQGSQFASLLPLVLIFFVFYFLLIRPQQRRFKEHAAMQEALKKGDQVVTGGGIVGKVTKVDGDMLSVEIASGVEVKVLKNTVSALANKPEAAPATTKKKGKADSVVKNDNVVLKKDQIANDN